MTVWNLISTMFKTCWSVLDCKFLPVVMAEYLWLTTLSNYSVVNLRRSLKRFSIILHSEHWYKRLFYMILVTKKCSINTEGNKMHFSLLPECDSSFNPVWSKRNCCVAVYQGAACTDMKVELIPSINSWQEINTFNSMNFQETIKLKFKHTVSLASEKTGQKSCNYFVYTI